MKHKKLLTVALLAIMSFNVFACGSTPEENTTASTTEVITETTTKATTEVATEIITEATTEITTEATTSTIEEQITEATEESTVIEEPEATEEITESSTEDTSVADTYDDSETQYSYILNTSTMKIHHPGCFSAERIAPQNYATSSESLEELESQGYTTCGNCF